MTRFPSLSTLSLPARAIHALRDAQGHQLTCHQGCLWVTLDHDPRDIILEPGQSFTLPDSRRAVIYALEDSRLAVRRLPEVLAPAPSRPTALPQAA